MGRITLRLGPQMARKQGLERVLITCDEENQASRRSDSLRWWCLGIYNR